MAKVTGNSSAKPVEGTTVTMVPGCDENFRGAASHSDVAHIQCQGVRIQIPGIFAAYLAERDNPEFAKFMESKVNDIVNFLEVMEARAKEAIRAGGR